jgi:acetylglutamate/LysW-gamma-L-alpha-aminoadipate kinase
VTITLTEAAPPDRRAVAPHCGPVVVKLGGSALDSLSDAWWDDLATVARHQTVVCVHGWSRELAAYQRAHGREPTFLVDQHGHRSRYTDEQTLADIRVVARLQREKIELLMRARGVDVAAASGDEHALLEATCHDQLWWRDGQLVRLRSLVGPARHVNLDALRWLLNRAPFVVVSPLAHSRSHGVVNTDGDRAAAVLARETRASALVLITDQQGVIVNDGALRTVRIDGLSALRAEVTGGMRKKLTAAASVVGSVERIVIGCDCCSALLHGTSGTSIVV